MHRRSKKQKQSGVTHSIEVLFWTTCVMCMAVIIWGSVGSKIIAEWSDVAGAVGSLDQSYRTSGMAVGHNGTQHPPTANGALAFWSGSEYVDGPDFCDQGCDCGVVMCIPAGGTERHTQP